MTRSFMIYPVQIRNKDSRDLSAFWNKIGLSNTVHSEASVSIGQGTEHRTVYKYNSVVTVMQCAKDPCKMIFTNWCA